MLHTKFSWNTGSEHLRIYGQIWRPAEQPVAVIGVIHGMGEHSGRYRDLAEFFTGHGFAVIAFDQRGHGKSEGKRGHIVHYNQLLQGIEELMERIKLTFGSLPVFLWGHSMGGNLVLNYVLKKSSGIVGLIVTGPLLRLAFEPSPLKIKLAKLMANLYPGFTQSSGLKTNHLSRDPLVVKAYEKDKYVHNKISASFFINIINAGYYALSHANELKIPTLIMHGTADKITSFEASEDFADKAKIMAEIKLWNHLYHEIHNEPEREDVLNYALIWMMKIINPLIDEKK